VFVDPDLLQYEEVWAAAGTWNDNFGRRWFKSNLPYRDTHIEEIFLPLIHMNVMYET